jgi:uncharacterized protein DUF4157
MAEYAGMQSRAEIGDEPSRGAAGSEPGKQTLTERLRRAATSVPVQRSVTDRRDAAEVAPVNPPDRPRPTIQELFGGHIHRSATAHTPSDASANADTLITRAARGSGQPLPDGLRTRFETSLGTGLGDVHVHNDSDAAAAAAGVGARAYATGQHIYMGEKQYAPHTADGALLLAHEVAHTVQQRGASGGPQYKLELSQPGDACEVEADRAASAMVGGTPATVSRSSGAARSILSRWVDPGIADAILKVIRGADIQSIQQIILAIETARAAATDSHGQAQLSIPGMNTLVPVADLGALEAQARRRFQEVQGSPPPNQSTAPGQNQSPTPAQNQSAGPVGSNAAKGAGLGLGTLRDVKLPPGVAPVNMNDRHVLDNLDFFKAVKPGPESGNSYLENPIAEETLAQLYAEAANQAVKRGVKTGEFVLANGQKWSVNLTTGKFFPVEGPGIIQLTQQEVRLLEQFVTRVKAVGGEAAVENVSRAFAGQKYSITPNMERALHIVARKIGVADELLTPLASAAPEAAVEATLLDAAKLKAAGRGFKVVKWGGRIMLVIAIAIDAYEIYEAHFSSKVIAKKAGSWAGSLASGGIAAEQASPLLLTGPWGWLAYGAIVGGAGALGYFAGGEVTETIYEWGLRE